MEIAAVQEEDQTACFFLPHLKNSEDYKVPVNPQEAEEFIDESTMCPTDCNEEFNEFTLTVMNALELHLPNTVNEALDVYVRLIKVILLKLFYYQTFSETWRNEHS